jgi:hypothetical protein
MRAALQRRWQSLLEQAGARISASRISPAALTVAAFAVSLVALPLIAREFYAAGLVVFLLGRSIQGLAAIADEAGERGSSAPALTTLDRIVFAAVPFGFALADPARAVAASFLLFGFVAVSSSSESRIRTIDALVCMAAFATACVVPAWFGVIAYSLGIACFAVTGFRLARSSA